MRNFRRAGARCGDRGRERQRRARHRGRGISQALWPERRESAPAVDPALARGARVYAEVLGFGMSADASDITAADADGGARAMRAALRDARTNPEDVDYV